MTNFLTPEEINVAYGVAIETHRKQVRGGIHVKNEELFATHFARAIERAVLERIAVELESRHVNGNFKYDTRHECADAVRQYCV